MRFAVKIETCPKCGCKSTENLVRVESGCPVKVYVRCAKCGTFVARYTIERYTSDKCYESLLKIMRLHGCSIASRSQAQELEAFSRSIETEFKETTQAPFTELKVEQIICGHKR
jgi:hypothetical protein